MDARLAEVGSRSAHHDALVDPLVAVTLTALLVAYVRRDVGGVVKQHVLETTAPPCRDVFADGYVGQDLDKLDFAQPLDVGVVLHLEDPPVRVLDEDVVRELEAREVYIVEPYVAGHDASLGGV
mgnify:CR=1 FL=1